MEEADDDATAAVTARRPGGRQACRRSVNMSEVPFEMDENGDAGRELLRDACCQLALLISEKAVAQS